jgi:HPt (histidine-containing phosphotransfer) domain-containing protein
MAHLALYTLGHAALEREVLELFCTQSVSYLDQLRAATSHKAWYQAAHALKGSARAVGAWRLARAAEYIEALREDSPPELRAAQIQELEASLQEAAAFVASLSDAGRK